MKNNPFSPRGFFALLAVPLAAFGTGALAFAFRDLLLPALAADFAFTPRFCAAWLALLLAQCLIYALCSRRGVSAVVYLLASLCLCAAGVPLVLHFALRGVQIGAAAVILAGVILLCGCVFAAVFLALPRQSGFFVTAGDILLAGMLLYLLCCEGFGGTLSARVFAAPAAALLVQLLAVLLARCGADTDGDDAALRRVSAGALCALLGLLTAAAAFFAAFALTGQLGLLANGAGTLLGAAGGVFVAALVAFIRFQQWLGSLLHFSSAASDAGSTTEGTAAVLEEAGTAHPILAVIVCGLVILLFAGVMAYLLYTLLKGKKLRLARGAAKQKLTRRPAPGVWHALFAALKETLRQRRYMAKYPLRAETLLYKLERACRRKNRAFSRFAQESPAEYVRRLRHVNPAAPQAQKDALTLLADTLERQYYGGAPAQELPAETAAALKAFADGAERAKESTR